MGARQLGGARALVAGEGRGRCPTVALTRLGQRVRGAHPVRADGGWD